MADVRICDAPAAPDFVRFREGFGQKFLLTVDTEEAFDWQAPFSRENHRVDAVPILRKFLQFCEGFGVVPVFLVDYPVATSNEAVEVLRDAVAAGRAELGMQMHPWVNPPHDEALNTFNSFAGNLPAELERAKFLRLRDAIESRFDVRPLIYRSGRYGAGPGTARILAENGIVIDSSVRSRFEYGSEGGPDYSQHPAHPYWLDRSAGLMELPLTTVFRGMLRQSGQWLFPWACRVPRLRSALAGAGLLERISLTPEGVTAEEAIHGIDIALQDGLPVLVFSFHSPSLVPGNTPYVRSHEDLDTFYSWWRKVIAYLGQRKIAPTSIAGIMSAVELA